MKKNRIISMACLFTAILFFSCEIDNYDAPDGTLTGRVIDGVTGNPISTEQPNGFRIRVRRNQLERQSYGSVLLGKGRRNV
jgi:hypothetical protein